MKAESMRLVVTSGPTREWLDPVRFISNPSSGRTGFELARKGLRLFKEVVFISGPGHPDYREVKGAVNIIVDSTNEMAKAVQKSVGPDTLLIMAAAPADFTLKNPVKKKMKKTESTTLELKLDPTIDILLSIKDKKYKNFFRVGFAAETQNVKKYALDKLHRKNLDLICGNRVYREVHGFSRDENTLSVFDRNEKEHTIGPGKKSQNAASLLKFIIRHLS